MPRLLSPNASTSPRPWHRLRISAQEIADAKAEKEQLKRDKTATKLTKMVRYLEEDNHETLRNSADVQAVRGGNEELRKLRVEYADRLNVFLIARNLWAPSAIIAFYNVLKKRNAAASDDLVDMVAMDVFKTLSGFKDAARGRESGEFEAYAPKRVGNFLDLVVLHGLFVKNDAHLNRFVCHVADNADDICTDRAKFDEAVEQLEGSRTKHGKYAAAHAMRTWILIEHNAVVPGDDLLTMGSGAELYEFKTRADLARYPALKDLDVGEIAFVGCMCADKPREPVDLDPESDECKFWEQWISDKAEASKSSSSSSTESTTAAAPAPVAEGNPAGRVVSSGPPYRGSPNAAGGDSARSSGDGASVSAPSTTTASALAPAASDNGNGGAMDAPGLVHLTGQELKYAKSAADARDGGCDYEGEWKVPFGGDYRQAVRHGRGVAKYPVQRSDDSWCFYTYDGEWKDDERHGLGVMTSSPTVEAGSCISTYNGEWVSGAKHGYGVLTDVFYKDDGSQVTEVYEGMWKDDMEHGYGVVTESDDPKGPYSGKWDKGELCDGSVSRAQDDIASRRRGSSAGPATAGGGSSDGGSSDGGTGGGSSDGGTGSGPTATSEGDFAGWTEQQLRDEYARASAKFDALRSASSASPNLEAWEEYVVKLQEHLSAQFPGNASESNVSPGGSSAPKSSNKRKRDAKRAAGRKQRKRDESHNNADGGAIPLLAADYRAMHGASSLTGGSKATCMADAAAMAMHDLGIQLAPNEARNTITPTWRDARRDNDSSMSDVLRLYNHHGFDAVGEELLRSNPLNLFRRREGVYHLLFKLTLLDKTGKPARDEDGRLVECKHAAIYNAAQAWAVDGAHGVGVMKDNQIRRDPVAIEEGDRVSMASAVAAMKRLWPKHRAMLITAYKLVPTMMSDN